MVRLTVTQASFLLNASPVWVRYQSPSQGGQAVEGDTEMANMTYFVQECPTCGRTLHVRVEYLGKPLVCQHCGGSLIASDPEAAPPSATRASRLLERADQLLQGSPRRFPGCA